MTTQLKDSRSAAAAAAAGLLGRCSAVRSFGWGCLLRPLFRRRHRVDNRLVQRVLHGALHGALRILAERALLHMAALMATVSGRVSHTRTPAAAAAPPAPPASAYLAALLFLLLLL